MMSILNSELTSHKAKLFGLESIELSSEVKKSANEQEIVEVSHSIIQLQKEIAQEVAKREMTEEEPVPDLQVEKNSNLELDYNLIGTVEETLELTENIENQEVKDHFDQQVPEMIKARQIRYDYNSSENSTEDKKDTTGSGIL